jgi:NAD(P)-dependent dehydrogenase (short-subunit alcohol dehydrogenase family)
MSRFSEKVCVITGVGINGIGWTTAELMAGEGAALVVGDINATAGEALVERVRSAGGEIRFCPTDLEKPADIEALCKTAVAEFGGIDILFNSAADQRTAESGEDSDAVNVSVEVWDHVMNVNLRSAFLTCKYSVPSMLSRGGGAIVNTGSIAGMVGERGRVAYGTSKAALMAFTQYVAAAYGHQGVRANSIAPGLVSRFSPSVQVTGAADGVDTGRPASLRSAEFLAAQAAQSLTGRLGTPHDVAELVMFLASDESRHITGQTIRIDGGLLSGVPRDKVKSYAS